MSKDTEAKLDGLDVSIMQTEQKLERRIAALETGLNARLDELLAKLLHSTEANDDTGVEDQAQHKAVNV